MSRPPPPLRVALEDGWTARGMGVGAVGETGGEFVFNTCLSGYQEVLTDPSYAGQVVVMTYPLIGNYGITAADDESGKPWVSGFVMRECVRHPSNWRTIETLPDYLERQGIVAVDGIDTRALTLHLRAAGALRGVIVPADVPEAEAVERARRIPLMEGCDLTADVTCDEPFSEGEGSLVVAAYDFGLKQNIVRRFQAAGCRVLRFPSDAPPEALLEHRPDGLFFSNGPGDPAAVTQAIAGLKRLAALEPDLPTFGICLGHSSSRSRTAARPTSSSSATTAGTTPCRTCARGTSTSRATTTASRCARSGRDGGGRSQASRSWRSRT